MSLPYYKRFPRDFLEGTIGLSFEVKGGYSLVLDLIYMRDGRLPDDARFIAGQLGCSVRKWTAIREELIARGKIQVHEGIISNFRADYLTEESRSYQDKQREIARAPRKNKDLPQPQASQSEPEPKAGEAIASPSPPKRAVADARRGSRIPDDWMPSRACNDFALAEGLTPQETARAAAEFRDYWRSRSGRDATKLDWPATWRNRVRAIADRKRPAGQAGAAGSARNGSKPVSMAGILAERRRQAQGSADVPDDGGLLREGGGVRLVGPDHDEPRRCA